MAQVGKTHFPTNPGSGYDNAYTLSQYTAVAPTGNVWFVSSTNASAKDSAGYGYSPEAPLATIKYAVATAAKADNDDLVLVLPGHVETITGAAGVNMSVAGVTVRGIGVGRQRPTVNYTTAVGASFDITAARCMVENLVFTPIGFDAITAAINVKAADCTIRNCEMETANATNQATVGILTTTAADRLVIQGCHFHGTNNAGTTNAIQVNGTTDAKILENIMQGAYSASLGAIQVTTTAAVNLLVGKNIIQNLTAASTKVFVDTITGTTGQLFENRVQILSGAAPFTGAAMSWVGANYFVQTIATAGVLI